MGRSVGRVGWLLLVAFGASACDKKARTFADDRALSDADEAEQPSEMTTGAEGAGGSSGEQGSAGTAEDRSDSGGESQQEEPQQNQGGETGGDNQLETEESDRGCSEATCDESAQAEPNLDGEPAEGGAGSLPDEGDGGEAGEDQSTAGTSANGGSSSSSGGASSSGASGDASGGSMDNPSGGAAEGSGGTSSVEEPNPVDRHFVDWPDGTDPLAIGQRTAEIFTSKSLATGSGNSNTDEYKHYKEACAWYGSLAVAQLAGERALINSLIAKYQPYKGTWDAFEPPTIQNSFVGYPDDSVFAIVPLEIAKFDSDPIYLAEGDLAADHQVALIDQQVRFSIEDMFHITALQVQAYRVVTDAAHRQRHLDTAAETMVAYLDAMQKDNGLFPHHLDRPEFGISWARGNGWFAAGMAELIRELPTTHKDYAAIEEGYMRMMNGLLAYQIPSGQAGAGLWRQVVDSNDPANWAETSGSAMFTYAFVSGVRRGWLDVDTFGPAARAAWISLVAQFDSDGLLQNISDWAYLPESHGYPADQYEGREEDYYFERGKLTGDSHGQAPMMWTAAALVRPLD